MSQDLQDLETLKLLRRNAPESLGGLMNVYEENYHRVLRLLPEKCVPFETAVSSVEPEHDLHLRVLERTAYTCTLHLSYCFEHDGCIIIQPDITLRLFHDAQIAEVLQCGDYERVQALTGFDFSSDSLLRHQWQPNLLLHKWLDYLLAKGHGFVLSGRPRR